MFVPFTGKKKTSFVVYKVAYFLGTCWKGMKVVKLSRSLLFSNEQFTQNVIIAFLCYQYNFMLIEDLGNNHI